MAKPTPNNRCTTPVPAPKPTSPPPLEDKPKNPCDTVAGLNAKKLFKPLE